MIETGRTLLRPILLNDKDQIYSYRSDAKTNKYQSWIPQTHKDVEAFILSNPKAFNIPKTWFQLAIVETETNTTIGDLGIHFIDKFQCEIGCTLCKNHQSKGFATESLLAVIDFLFEKLNKHRVVASVDPRNTNSIRLVKRLGLRKEAHFLKSLLIKGEWVDDLVFAILREEWNDRKN